jgi:hypothetical protein
MVAMGKLADLGAEYSHNTILMYAFDQCRGGGGGGGEEQIAFP